MTWIERFITESNVIEGITREPTKEEIEAHEIILDLSNIHVEHLQEFVGTVAPGNVLRDRKGLDVYVGDHVPPKGNPSVRTSLALLLTKANQGEDPYDLHHEYETLHPFTDGNGRSGRALWLWGMRKTNRLEWAINLGFLHSWYYQSLQAGQGRYDV